MYELDILQNIENCKIELRWTDFSRKYMEVL